MYPFQHILGKKPTRVRKRPKAASVQTEGEHYGTEAVRKRKADGQKPFTVKLNKHLPVCTRQDDQSIQSDTVSSFPHKSKIMIENE